MYRFLFELIIVFVGAMVVRSVLASVMKGFGAAAATAFQQQQQQQQNSQQQQQQPQQPKDVPRVGELHKDPVCGTYVSESSSFRRQFSGKTIYYCSDACRQKHAA